MAHVDRINMGDMYGVLNTRLKARTRAPDLVLPPRETPRRYASMAQKEACSGVEFTSRADSQGEPL